MKLSLSRYADSAAPWVDRGVTDKLSRIAGALGRAGESLSIVVVDDAYIQQLNRDYRGKDQPTDVLSFSYLDDSGASDDDLIGEVYVSHETLERDAKARRVDPGNLFVRTGVHGMLHVLGFDHESESDARRMEREERRLLEDHLKGSEVEELFDNR